MGGCTPADGCTHARAADTQRTNTSHTQTQAVAPRAGARRPPPSRGGWRRWRRGFGTRRRWRRRWRGRWRSSWRRTTTWYVSLVFVLESRGLLGGLLGGFAHHVYTHTKTHEHDHSIHRWPCSRASPWSGRPGWRRTRGKGGGNNNKGGKGRGNSRREIGKEGGGWHGMCKRT